MPMDGATLDFIKEKKFQVGAEGGEMTQALYAHMNNK
jgi:hypothetical protein